MGDRHLDNLFRRFRERGDVDALGRAFDAAAPELLRVARHLCRSEAEAEDAVQASFLTVLERAESFDEERRLLPWMLGILANHARELYRGAARVPDAERLTERRVPDPAEEAGDREFAGAVERAVTEVPASYREVVRLHLAGGLSSVEIAAATGLSPGTARVRLHRGLARLRKLLPVGFATGAAGGSAGAGPAARGLAALRTEVLAGATRVAEALPSTSSLLVPTSILGGFLVSQRFVLVSLAAVLFLLGGVWFAHDMEPFGASTSQEQPSEPIAMERPEPAEPLAAPAAETEAPAAAPERRSLEPGSPTVRFSGAVTDLHGPGVMVAGAEVWTTPVGETERVQRAETDERGRFSFEAAPEEEDTIFIEAAGFAPFRAPVSERAKERYRERHGRQVLDDGRRISIGMVELVRGIAVDGRVHFADGRPAVGAELFLFWHGLGGNEAFLPMQEHRVGTSGVGGRLDFDGRIPIQTRVGEGSSLLVAVAEGRLGWTPFAALKGREAIESLEIVIHEGRPLRVRVIDEADRPIAGARVTCERRGLERVATFRQDRSWHAIDVPELVKRFFVLETDANGVALFPSLPILGPDGSEPVRTPAFGLFAEAEGFAEASGYLDGGRWERLIEDPTAELTLRLADFEPARFTGRVVDPAGVPLFGATVELEKAGLIAQTDSAGRWELELPVETRPEGSLPLIARSEGCVDWKVYVPAPGSGVPEVALGDLVLGRRTRISGRVVDDQGRGVELAAVSLAGPRNGFPADIVSQRSGPDGTFVHEYVPEGDWELRVFDVRGSDAYDLPCRAVRATGGDEGVVLVVERPQRPTGRLIAELLDEETGAPLDAILAGIRFADDRHGERISRAAIEPGRVVVEELAAGPYFLWAMVPDRPPVMAAFDVAREGDEVRTQVRVGRAGSVRGMITPAEGRDFSNAWLTVSFLTANGPLDPMMIHSRVQAELGPREVEATGEFQLEGLTPGRWRIEVRCGKELSDAVEVEVVAHQESQVELPLHATGGILLVFGDHPAEGWAELLLRREGQPPERRGFFLVEGLFREYEIVLRPGRLEYEVSLPKDRDAETIRGALELKPGEWSRIDCEW